MAAASRATVRDRQVLQGFRSSLATVARLQAGLGGQLFPGQAVLAAEPTQGVAIHDGDPALYVEQDAEVYRYGMAFDRLRALALPGQKSAEFLASAADSIK